MNNIYTLVFSHKYIANKIFNAVHQLQLYNNSFKYEDIVDVEWMIENNHIQLLKDKLKRNTPLFVTPNHLFMDIGDKYTDIFIALFEPNHYRADFLDYYCTNEFLEGITNVQVVKYLFDKGLGREYIMSGFHQLFKINTNVLQYLVDNGYVKADFNSLLLNHNSDNKQDFFDKSKQSETRFKIKMIVEKYIESPISVHDAQDIIDSLLEFPTPYVMDTLVPLFDQGIKKIKFFGERNLIYGTKEKQTYIQALDEIRFKLEEEAEKKSPTPTPFWKNRLQRLPELQIWYSCIGKKDQEQEFINTWNRLSKRVVCTFYRIYYNKCHDFAQGLNFTDIRLETDLNSIDITNDILEIIHLVSTNGPNLMQMIHNRGWSDFRTLTEQRKASLCKSILKQSIVNEDQDYTTIILKMAVMEETKTMMVDIKFMVLLLSMCCDDPKVYELPNFNYFFEKFTQEIKKTQFGEDATTVDKLVSSLFLYAIAEKNVFLYTKLKSMGYCFLNYQHIHFNVQRFSPLIADIDDIIHKTPTEDKGSICVKLFSNFIVRKDFVGFKYLINKYKFFDENEALDKLALCNNLLFVHYINNNRSNCLFNVQENFHKEFFLKLFEKAFQVQNQTLAEYLILNILGYVDHPNNEYFEKIKNMEMAGFNSLVYLIDQLRFRSIEPIFNFLIDDEQHFYSYFNQIVEYIHRNQNTYFLMKPNFQFIFDKVITHLLKNQDLLKVYQNVLATLVNRYGCVFKDYHQEYLVEFKDILICYHELPYSTIIKNLHLPPTIEEPTTDEKPLKKQKKIIGNK
ncbi:hypothetical protein CYY_008204 [Polysphondylium violaceum]|uniref:Uncharacterized protein n=1 Tax=Polysphondylium violaceum TaxID=133409 RepID=A0A8J4PNH3_9MYCE|nr:hypothetical protein CYY_008204 [Polysphondylium violaceum]